MHVKKSIFALLLGLAIIIGGAGTYFVVELTATLEEGQQVDQSTDFMSEDEYEEMLNELTDAISLPKVVQAYTIIQSNGLKVLFLYASPKSVKTIPTILEGERIYTWVGTP